MTPQETHAAVVQMLQSQGVPLTTANLNRGMLALAQNDMSAEGATLPAVDAQIDSTTAPSKGFLPSASTQPRQPPNQPKADVASLPIPPTLPGVGDGGTADASYLANAVTPTSAEATAPVGAVASANTAPAQSQGSDYLSQLLDLIPGSTDVGIPQRTMQNSPVAQADPAVQALQPYALPEAPDAATIAPLILGGAGRALPQNLQLFLRERMLGGSGAGMPQLPGGGSAGNAIANTPTPRLPSPTQSLPAPQARAPRGKPFEGEAVDNFARAEGGAPTASANTAEPSLKKTLTARQKNAAQRSTRKKQ